MRGESKNYAYRVLTGVGREKTLCKVRDVFLNYNASKFVYSDVIRDMIMRGKQVDYTCIVNV